MADTILEVDELEMALTLVDEMGRMGVCVEINLVTGGHVVDGVSFSDFHELADHCRGLLCRMAMLQ